jgi:hypothetical protein
MKIWYIFSSESNPHEHIVKFKGTVELLFIIFSGHID